MASMITITGHLGADAERKRVGEHDLAELRVAVSTGWGDRKITTWWRVQQWGAPAAWVGEGRKGDAVTVIGEAWLEEWTSRDGKTGSTPTIRAVEVTQHVRRDASGSTGGGGNSSSGRQGGNTGNGRQGGWGGGKPADGDGY